jgi:hypothetical protein
VLRIRPRLCRLVMSDLHLSECVQQHPPRWRGRHLRCRQHGLWSILRGSCAGLRRPDVSELTADGRNLPRIRRQGIAYALRRRLRGFVRRGMPGAPMARRRLHELSDAGRPAIAQPSRDVLCSALDGEARAWRPRSAALTM